MFHKIALRVFREGFSVLKKWILGKAWIFQIRLIIDDALTELIRSLALIFGNLRILKQATAKRRIKLVHNSV